MQDVEPTCFDEAVGNVNWEKSINQEMASLHGNETWILVSLIEGKKVIECKWVYKVKHSSDGSINMYKARLVTKGLDLWH